jgi:two-component system sensor histidine kinase AgrC
LHNSIDLVFLSQIIYSLILLWGIQYQIFLHKRQTILLSLFVFSTYFIKVFSIFEFKYMVLIFFLLFQIWLVYRNYRNFLISLLSLITSYTLLLVVSFFTFDLPRIIFNMKLQINNFIFYLFMFFGCVVLTTFCWIIHYLADKFEITAAFASIEKKNMLLSMIIFILYYLMIMIHQELFYPAQTTSVLFSLLYLMLNSILLCYAIYQTILSYNREKEYQQLNKTLEAIKAKYETIQEFRHDYKDILRSISGYLESDELEASKRYVATIIDYSFPVLVSEYYSQLEKIHILPIQSVLASFGEEMTQKNLPFRLLVKNRIIQLDINTIDFVRCLSILLTNAKEELLKQENGQLQITISSEKNKVIFMVRNTLVNTVSLSSLAQDGYTTKTDHQGKGLYIIKKIVKRHKNLDFTIKASKNLYTATLTIENTNI